MIIMHHNHVPEMLQSLVLSIVSTAPAEDLALASIPTHGVAQCYCGCASAEFSATLDGIHSRRNIIEW
ncbi:hypothetical protein [Nocardia sp. NPDC051570]|uniref:hypothetical protein n=1 Tax=Nocardia sp. NPDC051570 TaxID=3364324 RepID=UPI0037996617